MIEQVGAPSLPRKRPTCADDGLFRRLGIVLFGLVLVVLTSVAHLSHTCLEGSVRSIPDDADPGGSRIRAYLDERNPVISCLGCLLLKCIQSTRAAPVFIMLGFMVLLYRLIPHPWPTLFPEISASGFRIRAPPTADGSIASKVPKVRPACSQ